MPERTIYYDRPTKRLVFTDHAPDANYWDDRWQSSLERGLNSPVPPGGSFITNATKRYLPKGSKVLEGGCGNGMHSRHLHEAGYDMTSVDWAPTTIEWLKKNVPQINPIEADLRALPFADASFDGFWSLGVIEHFYDGYQPLADEMRRVIRPGGMLFLVFPYMSPLRTAAGELGYFPQWREDEHREEFHQFALRHREVVAEMAADYEVLSEERLMGLSGFEGILDGAVASLSRKAEKSRNWRRMRSLLDKAVRPVTAHMILLCMRRL